MGEAHEETMGSETVVSPVLDLARARHGAGDLAGARTLLEQAIRDNPDDYAPLDLEVEVLVEQGEIDLARRLLDEYIRYYPENADASARLGWVLWKSGNADDAIAELRATLARNPESVRAWAWLAEWLRTRLEDKDALAAAEKGLALAPDHPGLRRAAAMAAARTRDAARARQHFEHLTRVAPQDEESVRTFAEFLLDQELAAEALARLEPWLAQPAPHPRTVLRAVDACFRIRQRERALHMAALLAGDPRADQDPVQNELQELLLHHLGLLEFDKLSFSLIESLRVTDSYAVNFLERSGMRGHRGHLVRLFGILGANAHVYPRAMARYLSTYWRAPIIPGTVARWVAANTPLVESNTVLWGGVGAWMVQRSDWRAALAHLGRYRGRPGLKPWMLLLLGKAQESQDMHAAANQVYREALQMEPDHSEMEIRSRLAFNLAMEGMAGAGKLVLTLRGDRMRELTAPEDMVRILAVEALSSLPHIIALHEREALIEETTAAMRRIIREGRYSGGAGILKAFRRRAQQLLVLPREP